MKLLTNILLLLILSTFSIKLNAQDPVIDSLKLALKNAKHDTTRCNILYTLIEGGTDDKIWVPYNRQLLELSEKCALTSTHSSLRIFYLKYQSYSLFWFGVLANQYGDIPKSLEYINKSLKIRAEIQDKEGIANSLNYIGLIYKSQGDIPKAIDYYHRSLKIREEINDKSGIAISLNNIGFIYKDQGDIPKALDYFHKSLKIREEIKIKGSIAESLNNIGLIYNNQGDFSKALEFYERSLMIQEEINDKSGIALSLNNIGVVYNSQGNTIKALEFYHRSLMIQEEINNKFGIALSLNNIGTIYNSQGNITKALEYFRKSLEINEKIKYKVGISRSLDNIGDILLQQNKVVEALFFAQRSLQVARELGFPENMRNAATTLKKIYKKQNKFKEALEMYELETNMNDSINNEATKKASVKKQFQYQYEKKAAADSVKNAEQQKVKNAQLTAQKAQLKQEKTKSYALYGGLALVMIFAGFMVNRFRVTHKQKQIIELKEIETQKQNEIITHQKHLVEEKHKEITDSINYAERIQRSFLASTELLDENLSSLRSRPWRETQSHQLQSHAELDSVSHETLSRSKRDQADERDYFVFFQPKDVVSGDFYWAASTGSATNKKFILATADSTGHGVPGAIMSILNISCLEKSVEEEKLTEPADILNHTRVKIIERLKKDGSPEGGKDGMDCSLICFDFVNSKLTYAAANNPVWIIRNISANLSVRAESRTENKFELHELAPDKMPVGKHDKDFVPFIQHSIDLQKGDVVYTLTDGYADQFGGPKGKKFMYKQLKQLLIANVHLSMTEQSEILNTKFKEWKGDLEQVDDVCIIGIKI